jgi:hypothetical protein
MPSFIERYKQKRENKREEKGMWMACPSGQYSAITGDLNSWSMARQVLERVVRRPAFYDHYLRQFDMVTNVASVVLQVTLIDDDVWVNVFKGYRQDNPTKELPCKASYGAPNEQVRRDEAVGIYALLAQVPGSNTHRPPTILSATANDGESRRLGIYFNPNRTEGTFHCRLDSSDLLVIDGEDYIPRGERIHAKVSNYPSVIDTNETTVSTPEPTYVPRKKSFSVEIMQLLNEDREVSDLFRILRKDLGVVVTMCENQLVVKAYRARDCEGALALNGGALSYLYMPEVGFTEADTHYDFGDAEPVIVMQHEYNPETFSQWVSA